MQAGLSDLEYGTKKKMVRRDDFLVEIDAIMPWSAPAAEIMRSVRARPAVEFARRSRPQPATAVFEEPEISTSGWY
jgi:hypothetical protein